MLPAVMRERRTVAFVVKAVKTPVLAEIEESSTTMFPP